MLSAKPGSQFKGSFIDEIIERNTLLSAFRGFEDIVHHDSEEPGSKGTALVEWVDSLRNFQESSLGDIFCQGTVKRDQLGSVDSPDLVAIHQSF